MCAATDGGRLWGAKAPGEVLDAQVISGAQWRTGREPPVARGLSTLGVFVAGLEGGDEVGGDPHTNPQQSVMTAVISSAAAIGARSYRF